MKYSLNVLIILSILFCISCRKSDYVLEENEIEYTDNGSGTGTVTWTKDKTWFVKGFVFVNDGQTLTIEPGAVVKFRTGQSSTASALIIARGGKIIAEGTAEEPIIFTSEKDDLNGSLDTKEKGLWGGLIILGNAPLNTPSGEAVIEGIPLSDQRIVYGGNVSDDDSGILKYVSIRHGGTEIGEGNEINGLTLGGVGSGTTIEHIEVIANADDGIEFFGGTVNTKYLLSAYNGDDAFDYDLGYQGNNQFWFAVQDEYSGDYMIEADGGQEVVNTIPYSIPYIYNCTFIGANTSQLKILGFRNNAGGHICNSIFTNFKQGVLLSYENGVSDSYAQWQNNNISVQNNVFYQVKENNADEIFQVSGNNPPEGIISNWSGYFDLAENAIQHLDISIYNPIPFNQINDNLAVYPGNSFFEEANFKGAFGTYLWFDQWTLYSQITNKK